MKIRIAQIVFLVTGFALFLPTLWSAALNPSQSDFTTYYYATKWAFSIPFRHPYSNLAPLYPFFYPPGALVFFRPLNLFSYPAAVFSWTFLSFISFVGGLFLLFKSLEKVGLGLSRLQQSLIFFFLSFFWPLKFTFLSGQANAIIFFFLSTAFFCYLRKKNALAGLSLALATILKISPALLLLYFLIRRRWRIFLWGIFFILVFSLVAEIGVRWDKSVNWHYFRHVVHHVSDQGGPNYRDQSLLSFIMFWRGRWDRLYSRYFEPYFGEFLSGKRFYALINYFVVSLPVVIILALAWFSQKTKRCNPRVLLEYSVLLILGVVGSGLCWYHQYAILIFPLLTSLAFVLGVKPGVPRGVFLALIFAVFLAWAINWEPLTTSGGHSPRLLTSIMLYGAFVLYGILFSHLTV